MNKNGDLLEFLAAAVASKEVDEDVASVIGTVGEACARIKDDLESGDCLGDAGTSNVQGEDQKKMDVRSNEVMKSALRGNPAVRGIASEEEELPVSFVDDHGGGRGDLLVLFDPLDGSSNIDIDAPVGTIFSVIRSRGAAGELREEEFLKPGTSQLAAGYVIYGPSTIMVLSAGGPVRMFTLAGGEGRWMEKDARIVVPESAREFAINVSNRRFWAEPVRIWVDQFMAGADGPLGRNYNMRWVASMVAEVHRILTRGGVFSYPWDSRDPAKPGKLRLMYEVNPMAYLVTRAGGLVTNGVEPAMEIQPTSLHQRVPVFLGAKNDVERVAALMSDA